MMFSLIAMNEQPKCSVHIHYKNLIISYFVLMITLQPASYIIRTKTCMTIAYHGQLAKQDEFPGYLMNAMYINIVLVLHVLHVIS